MPTQVFSPFVARLIIKNTSRRIGPVAVLAMLLVAGGPSIAHGQLEATMASARLIGATTTVTEVSTGLPFAARVDTGATTCSIHCEAIEIEDASPDPKSNIGKPIRFLIRNKKGESNWVQAEIADHVMVRTSEKDDSRYKVRLDLQWEDMKKSVLVTLNDRQHMKYPVLIGRNFLRDDFLVNVNWEDQQ
jgi:hypothetical protein